ncbi:MAG: hypothetical protein KGJ13_04650 [Patescibacteria group bacterium]|nr:hypothetical protein [Patescibacteria group bacterium]
MTIINNLTDDASQVVSVGMPDGSIGQLALYFRATPQRWFFDFTHSSFPNGAIMGMGLCVHPNILRNFMNVIPFGMACITGTGLDPVSADDFVNGNATLYLLSQSDVAAVEAGFYTP